MSPPPTPGPPTVRQARSRLRPGLTHDQPLTPPRPAWPRRRLRPPGRGRWRPPSDRQHGVRGGPSRRPGGHGPGSPFDRRIDRTASSPSAARRVVRTGRGPRRGDRLGRPRGLRVRFPPHPPLRRPRLPPSRRRGHARPCRPRPARSPTRDRPPRVVPSSPRGGRTDLVRRLASFAPAPVAFRGAPRLRGGGDAVLDPGSTRSRDPHVVGTDHEPARRSHPRTTPSSPLLPPSREPPSP